MDDLSKRIQSAHTLCKDTTTTTHLSKDDDKAACSAMYEDISKDLEVARGLLAKLGCPKAESLVKAIIQNWGDVKNAYDEEVVNSK